MSLPEIHTRRFALEDIEIAYSEVEGASPALVLVHGFTGHRDDFTPQLAALAETGTRVLVPDLRGHGDSTHGGRPERFTFDQLVEDLHRFARRLELAPFDLLGHSLGGMVALRYARTHPSTLRSLLLMNTSPFAPDGYTTEGFEKAGEIAESRGMAFLQGRIERRAHARPTTAPADLHTETWADAYWPHQRRRYRAMDPMAYRALGREMMGQPSQVEGLSELRMPVTVMVGRDDVNFLAGADALASGIPSAERVDIEDAGHHPHRENTGAWLAALRAHRQRAGSGARD